VLARVADALVANLADIDRIAEHSEDVGVTAQVGAAHTPGVIEVRERAFDQFAAPPHQTAGRVVHESAYDSHTPRARHRRD
jgi:hypothetical protein